MYSQLYKSFKYLTSTKYLINNFIREYDIRKANINILYYYKVIDKKYYDYLYELDKTDKKLREIKIGLLMKEKPEVADILKKGFIEFRRRFFEANGIQDFEILSIKNDAIFVINKIPSVTKFDNVEFINKNTYTSYYNLLGTEYYYSYDKISNKEQLDIKGINDKLLYLHQDYFIDFLKACFCSAEVENINDVINMVMNFNNQYINKQVEIRYYRELNSESRFRFRSLFNYFGDITSDNVSNKNINFLDISYNLNIIRELYKIYSSIYFNKINNKRGF